MNNEAELGYLQGRLAGGNMSNFLVGKSEDFDKAFMRGIKEWYDFIEHEVEPEWLTNLLQDL